MQYLAGAKKSVVGTGMLSFIKLGSENTEEATPASSDSDGVRPIIDSNDVVVFSSSSCPYCARAVSVLQDAGVTHTVVECDGQQRRELQDITGSRSVPNIWVKGTFIGGFNDGPEDWMGLGPCLRSGKLQDLLKA